MYNLYDPTSTRPIDYSIPVETLNRMRDMIEQQDHPTREWCKIDGYYYRSEIARAIHAIKHKYPDACFAPGLMTLRSTFTSYQPFSSVWVYRPNAFRAYVRIGYQDYAKSNDNVRYCYGVRHVRGKSEFNAYKFSFVNNPKNIPKHIGPYLKRPTQLIDVCEARSLEVLHEELQGKQVTQEAADRQGVLQSTTKALGIGNLPMYLLSELYASPVFRETIRRVSDHTIQQASPEQVEAANKLMPYVDEIEDVQSMGQEMTDIVVVSKVTSTSEPIYVVGRAYGHDVFNFQFNEGPRIFHANNMPSSILDAMLMLDNKFSKTQPNRDVSIPMVGSIPQPGTYYLHSRYADRGDLS